MKKDIVVLATLDTKGIETAYVRDLIASRGYNAIVIDCGLLGTPSFEPGVSREQVAHAAGTTVQELLDAGNKNAAIRTMAEGAKQLVLQMHQEGNLAGVLGLGGVQGTFIGTFVMQALPVGVPKVMLSTVANGQATFGPFIGTKDIAIIHSVADILGLNTITRQVLSEAAGAVTGMADLSPAASDEKRPTVAITMAGVTTPTVMRAREILEGLGYEVIGFHCNGIGAKAMEELVAAGRVVGVLDLSPHDITDYLFDGLMRADPQRMEATANAGIPQVVVPGAADFILYGPVNSIPAQVLERKHVVHNPIHTHVRATRQEMREVGKFIAERLALSKGPAVILVPHGGFSQLNKVNSPLFDPDADAGFLEGVREQLALTPAETIRIIETDAHINDPSFAELAASQLHDLIGSRTLVP